MAFAAARISLDETTLDPCLAGTFVLETDADFLSALGIASMLFLERGRKSDMSRIFRAEFQSLGPVSCYAWNGRTVDLASWLNCSLQGIRMIMQENQFDAIILGTGLVESITAA